MVISVFLSWLMPRVMPRASYATNISCDPLGTMEWQKPRVTAAMAPAAPGAAPAVLPVALPLLALVPGPLAGGARAIAPDPRFLVASYDMFGPRHIEFRQGVLGLVRHP